MFLASPPESCLVKESSQAFFDLFPHRFDYIYAPHPEPGTKPHWQTESRHPLTNRLLNQSSYLYGVRFGVKTRYCLLDIDAGSPYHPDRDGFAVQRILGVLEPLGLTRCLICTSSYSGGLHIYFPFQSAQKTWELGATLTVLLENAGFSVKPGCLEVFPNHRSPNTQGKPSLFNAHRLPLQMGSYLLNQDFEPVWTDRFNFVQQWQSSQQHNEIPPRLLSRILKQNQRERYQISGKAAKFLNDLNAEIELGWTGYGQTNYLLGRIAMRTYIFHHILEGSTPLIGQSLVDEIIAVARSLPGYQEWCQHQHEIEHRAAEWARCVENSHYFPYGTSSCINNTLDQQSAEPSRSEQSLNWNQQQSENTKERIRQAIADLLNQNALPAQATARFKALTQYGIGGASLYRYKDLWHPNFLVVPEDQNFINNPLNPSDQYTQLEPVQISDQDSTNLLAVLDGNSAQPVDSSDQEIEDFGINDGNTTVDASFDCSTHGSADADASYWHSCQRSCQRSCQHSCWSKRVLPQLETEQLLLSGNSSWILDAEWRFQSGQRLDWLFRGFLFKPP